MTTENETLVLAFCTAWGRRDIDELLAYFAEDAVYHNIPIAEAVGHDAIRNVLQLVVPVSEEIAFEMRAIASKDGLVFTERVDRFVMDGRTIELPVAGVFEIRDAKITAWRDYFDMATFTGQMG